MALNQNKNIFDGYLLQSQSGRHMESTLHKPTSEGMLSGNNNLQSFKTGG